MPPPLPDFWYATTWTAVATIFTILSFFLALVGHVKPNLFPLTRGSRLRAIQHAAEQIARDFELRLPEAMSGDIHALQLALTSPPGASVRTLWGPILELQTGLQLLTIAVREVQKECQGVQTEVRALAPVFLEILLKLRRPEMEALKIQGGRHRLPYANQLGMGPAQALVRQRIQALFPNPLREPSRFRGVD